MTATTKRKPDAFQFGGDIYDWYAGQLVERSFAGTVLVGDSVMRTWVENGERNWQYLRQWF